MAGKALKIALVQLAVGPNKIENLARAKQLVKTAVNGGASIISLPECFNSGIQYFSKYAEQIPGQSTEMLSTLAKEHDVFIVGGSIPEEENGKYFNTCTVFAPNGDLVAKHRKVHLFDVDISGKITVLESKIVSPGDSLTTFETPFCKIGVGICYDMRFSEMAQIYAKQGCKLLFYPGAFNMTTGPAHWELLIRNRALDNQLYVASVSSARDEDASYVAWGHSMVANPWGEVIAKCQHQEEVLFAEVDLSYVDAVRSQIPLTVQRRHDLYSVDAHVK